MLRIFRYVWRRINAFRLRFLLKKTVRTLADARTLQDYIDRLGQPHDRVAGEMSLHGDETNKVIQDVEIAVKHARDADTIEAIFMEAAERCDEVDLFIGDNGWVFYVKGLMLVAYEKDGIVHSLSGQAIPTAVDRVARCPASPQTGIPPTSR